MQNRTNPRAYVLGAIAFWAFGGTLIGLMVATKVFSILTVAFAASTLTNWFYFRRNSGPAQSPFLWEGKALFFGLFGYFIYNIGYGFSVIHYGNVSEPTILNYTWPFFTALFTLVMYRRQKVNALFIVSTVLGLTGIFVLASKGSIWSLDFMTSKEGLLFGLLAGSSYGLFSAYSSSVSEENLPRFLFTSTFVATILMGIFAYWYHGKDAFVLIWSDWCLALISGVFLDAIGYILWTKAQVVAVEVKEDITNVVSLSYYLPILSLMIVALVFQEKHLMQPYFILAVLLVTSSALVPYYFSRYQNYKKRNL